MWTSNIHLVAFISHNLNLQFYQNITKTRKNMFHLILFNYHITSLKSPFDP
jgi:hypothetical protein